MLGQSGAVYPGCNIEAPSAIHHVCAERAAIFNAISRGERKLAAVCVVSPTAYPCGTCRQAILEFVGIDAPIYVVLDDPRTGRRRTAQTTARKLLPHAYTDRELGAGAEPVGFRRK